MNHVWVLVMVTALTPFDYEVKPLAQTNTMAECYFQSTVTEVVYCPVTDVPAPPAVIPIT